MRILVQLVCLALAAQLVNAQPNPWNYWNLEPLQPGRQITVETQQAEEKIKGVFVSRGADDIFVRLRNGDSQTISRQNIRKVTVKRESYRHAPLIGAAIGGGAFGGAIGAKRERLDFTRSAVVAFALVGAGIGALIGWAVRSSGQNEVIYQAPRP